MVRDLLAQGVAAGELDLADVEMTSKFVQAIGMEAVRQIHDDPASHPEEATIKAVRRLITGEREVSAGGSTAAPASAPAKKKKSKKDKKR